MSSYKEFRAQSKRRRMKKVATRVFLIFIILALIFAACYFAIVMFADGNLFGLFNPDRNGVNSMDMAPIASMPEPPATEPVLPQAVTTALTWNSPVPLPRTVNIDKSLIKDYRILSVPQNGKVTEEYFKTSLFIGDSLTQGMGIYPMALKERTTVCAYRSAGPKTITDNMKARNVRGEYTFPHEDIFAVAPDNIYVLFGTNTIVSSITDDGFIAQYAEMLDFLKAGFNPKVKFYVQGMPPVTAPTAAERPRMNNERIRDLNSRIAVLAQERDMYFVDLMEMIADANGDLPLELAAADGFHFNEQGYGIWKEYLQTHTVYSPMHLQHYEVQPSAG